MEKRRSVDQKLQLISSFFDAHELPLSEQGSIVESWREHNGKKLGPYYRLACRLDGRQKSLYLGQSEELVAIVRARLKRLQEPRKSARITLRVIKQLREQVRICSGEWSRQLATVGLTLKGSEVRGWRRSQLTGTKRKEGKL